MSKMTVFLNLKLDQYLEMHQWSCVKYTRDQVHIEHLPHFSSSLTVVPQSMAARELEISRFFTARLFPAWIYRMSEIKTKPNLQENAELSIDRSLATRALFTANDISFAQSWLFSFSLHAGDTKDSKCALISDPSTQWNMLCLSNTTRSYRTPILDCFLLFFRFTPFNINWEWIKAEYCRFELSHQLIFALDKGMRQVVVFDANTRRYLFHMEDQVDAIALDSGLSAGHSRHVHFLTFPWDDNPLVRTYTIGRKEFTLSRRIELRMPEKMRFGKEANMLVCHQHIYIAREYHNYILQFYTQAHDTSSIATLFRVIDTLAGPRSLGLMSDGRLVFCTRGNVYIVLSSEGIVF